MIEMKAVRMLNAGLTSLVGFLASMGSLVGALDCPKSVEDLRQIEQKIERVAKERMGATVALVSESTSASGSGVIHTPEGLILTAAHVIQGAERVMVIFPNGRQEKGRVLGANYSKDVAMVQLEGKGPWPCAPMGRSRQLAVGEWVVALGHSAGYLASRTPPVRFGRVISKGPGAFLTTDCTLIGGDSGGALFDLEGNVVGIHSSIGVSLANNNHAGIDGMKEDWERLLAGDAWGELSLNPFANPEMPVLGIGMAMRYVRPGVLIESVVPQSPAALAGLQVGDVIVAFESQPIRQGKELLQLLAKKQSGDEVTVDYLRSGKKERVSLKLKPRNQIFSQR